MDDARDASLFEKPWARSDDVKTPSIPLSNSVNVCACVRRVSHVTACREIGADEFGFGVKKKKNQGEIVKCLVVFVGMIVSAATDIHLL